MLQRVPQRTFFGSYGGEVYSIEVSLEVAKSFDRLRTQIKCRGISVRDLIGHLSECRRNQGLPEIVQASDIERLSQKQERVSRMLRQPFLNNQR